MDGFLRNSHGETRASSSKTALFSLESDCSECTLILPNVEVDTVVFFDPSWRRLRIFFADLGNSADPVDLPMGQVFFSTSPPAHHLQSILNYFEYSTPVQRTSKCNIMIYYDIIHSVFSLKSFFWKQVQKKMSLIFPTSLSQVLVNQEIDQVRQELLEERLKKRRAREVEDNLVKQARGQLSK